VSWPIADLQHIQISATNPFRRPVVGHGGYVAIHAVNTADARLLRIIGFYLLAVGVLGSLALAKSPFWVGVVSSAVLVGAGYGWVR
jgi:hypothetical protein